MSSATVQNNGDQQKSLSASPSVDSFVICGATPRHGFSGIEISLADEQVSSLYK